MKKFYTTLAILVITICQSLTNVFAQPSNDLCENAIPILCGDVLSGTTIGASIDVADFCTVPITTNGVWYKFTGDGSVVNASTCNSDYDGQLSVYSGTCGALICVGGNDDFCGQGGGSSVNFCSMLGTDYYILVHGWNDSTGNFELALTCGQPVQAGFIISGPVCSGGSPLLSLNGNTLGTTVQWQQSALSGGPYIDITGAVTNYISAPPITQTTYYMLTATCGSTTGSTDALQVDLATQVYPEYINGAYTNICDGASTQLNYINNYYNFPGLLLQWQQSTVSGGPYTDIPGATDDTLNTPAVNETTYYVTQLTCSGNSVLTDEAPLYIATAIDPVTISSYYSQIPLCPNTSIDIYEVNYITLGTQFQWQQSAVSGGPYTDIPGADSMVYTTPQITQDVYYLLNASCGSLTSVSNELPVVMGAEAGNVYSTHFTVCAGASAQLSRDLYSYYSPDADLQWQQSLVSGGPYTDIPGEITSSLTTPPIAQTTYFVLKASCGGFSNISNEIEINVGAESGYIYGNSTLICPGTSTEFYLDLYSTGSPGADLQWQQSSVSGGPYTDIPGATDDTLTTPPVNGTTYFVLRFSCGGTIDVSNEVSVDVYTSMSPGYIYNYSTPFPICSGGTATLAYNNGYPSGNIQWKQSSVSGGPYTNLPGEIGNFYTTQPLTQTTYYVVTESCGSLSATSDEIAQEVGVYVGDIYSYVTALCPGGSTTLNSTSFSDGASLQWQQSSVSGGPYTDIPGETGTTLTIPPITQNTYYVLQGSCGGATSISPELVITLSSSVNPGTITIYGGSPLCSGTSIELQDADAYYYNPPGATWQWQQSSVSGGPYYDIPGENDFSYFSPPITQNTYYVLKTLCGSVNATTSEIWIEVAANPSAGTMYNYSGTPVVCPGQSVYLYQYGNTYGSSLQWQQSLISGGPYSDIPGEFFNDYNTPPLAQNTYYVVKASCGSLSAITPEVAVNVGVSAGTINIYGAPTISMCNGGSTTIYQACCPVGSAPGADLQWQQSSVSGGPYVDIPGETGFSFTTPSLSQTTYYVLKASCSGASAISNEVAVKIGPDLGTVSGSTTVCTGFSANLSQYGGTYGQNLQWRQSASAGGPFTDIPGANSNYYTTPSLTQTTYFDLTASCPDGSSVTSDVITVTVAPYPVGINCDGEVVVENDITINFTKNPPVYSGDPALQSYFTYYRGGSSRKLWNAIFDVGMKKLVIKNGATISTTMKGGYAPGIILKGSCGLEIEDGGHVVVNSFNRNAGNILFQFNGNIQIDGEVRNEMTGLKGLPGSITLASKYGSETVGQTGLIQCLGFVGGNNISLLTCGETGTDCNGNSLYYGSDITVNGLVKSYTFSSLDGLSLHKPNVKAVAFVGSLYINANTVEPLYDEFKVSGLKYDLYGGLLSWVGSNTPPGKVEAESNFVLAVTGHGTDPTAPVRKSFGAIAAVSTGSKSGGGFINVDAKGGFIYGIDRAFDVSGRNRLFGNNAHIKLSTFYEIYLDLSDTNNVLKVVDASSPSAGGKGGKIEMHAGSITIGTNAVVSANVPAGAGSVQGVNLLSSCYGISNSGTVIPSDLNTGDDINTCGYDGSIYISHVDCQDIDGNFRNENNETLSVVADGDDLLFYPNPTRGAGTLKFNCPEKEDKYTMHIMDLTGRIVINELIRAHEGENIHSCDLSSVSKGIYFLMIENSTGRQQVKIVVE